MRSLESLEAAYIAGIIDGEGTISYSCGLQKGSSTGLRFQFYVSVANTEIDLITYLKDKCQSGGISLIPSVGKSKAAYKINWCGSRGIELLLQVEPYLIIKKSRARLMIDLWKKSKDFLDGRNTPDWLWAERIDVYEKMRELNKRGVD